MDDILSEEEYMKLPSLENAGGLEIAEAVRDVMSDKKGKDIKVFKLGEENIVAEYYVLCTGTSGTHVRGIIDEIEYKLGLRHICPSNIEGRGNGSWIAMDYGSVVVHVFDGEARAFYNLDRLCGEGALPNTGENGSKGE